jgi:hypothetical protein
MATDLYVTLDPASVRAAEEREWREQLAGSSVVRVTRLSAEELRREAFWREVERQREQQRRVTPFRRDAR